MSLELIAVDVRFGRATTRVCLDQELTLVQEDGRWLVDDVSRRGDCD